MVFTSYETCLKFSSDQVGAIGLMNDAGVLVSVISLSLIWELECGNKPLWLAMSLVIQSLACFMFSLPQWIFGKYSPGFVVNLQELCSAESSVENAMDVMECSLANYSAFAICLIAGFILGIAMSPLFTCGVSFVDDIVHPNYVLCSWAYFTLPDSLVLSLALPLVEHSCFIMLTLA